MVQLRREADEQVREAERRSAEADRRRREAEGMTDSILGSASWRLTAPLRAARRRLRRRASAA